MSRVTQHAAVLPFTLNGRMNRRARKQRSHMFSGEERTVRFERLAGAGLMTQRIARLNVELVVNQHKPPRAFDDFIITPRSKIPEHVGATRQRRIRQRTIETRLKKRKREHAIRRQHSPQGRSEERRVGKECRRRGSEENETKKK